MFHIQQRVDYQSDDWFLMVDAAQGIGGGSA